MPTQTKSSRKKADRGKGPSFSYQDNPFYVEEPITNKPSSSDIPIYDQPLSPIIFGTKQERWAVKHNAYDDLSIHATDSESSSSESKSSEPTKTDFHKCQKDKDFWKMMKVIMAREKEDYFLELAKQGAKLPTSYNVEALITKEEEIPLAMVNKQLQALWTEIT